MQDATKRESFFPGATIDATSLNRSGRLDSSHLIRFISMDWWENLLDEMPVRQKRGVRPTMVWIFSGMFLPVER